MQQLSCLKGLCNILCCTNTVSICSYKNNLWWKNSTLQLYHDSLIFFFQSISILYWTELQVALFFYTLSHGATQLQDSKVMEQTESLNEKCNPSLLALDVARSCTGLFEAGSSALTQKAAAEGRAWVKKKAAAEVRVGVKSRGTSISFCGQGRVVQEIWSPNQLLKLIFEPKALPSGKTRVHLLTCFA